MMTSKRDKPPVMLPVITGGYQLDEQAEMQARGYLTARAAADLFGVRVDRVYRAIKTKKVRVELGANAYTRYVHRGDWETFMNARRQKVIESLGLEPAGE